MLARVPLAPWLATLNCQLRGYVPLPGAALLSKDRKAVSVSRAPKKGDKKVFAIVLKRKLCGREAAHALSGCGPCDDVDDHDCSLDRSSAAWVAAGQQWQP